MAWSHTLPLAAIAMFGLMMTPGGQAGTREDPEVVDAPNDVTRYPGVPTVDPTVDILAIWFVEGSDDLAVSMEIAQVGSDVPEVTNVNHGESYAVNVFVDGENTGDERCSGWGDFGVRWGSGQSSGDLSYGWQYDGNGCPAENEPVRAIVEANVITWTVPKASLAMLRSGSELTVARADAWSGDTWPLTPDDRADDLPGRGFVVQSAPQASAGSEVNEVTNEPRTDTVADGNATEDTDAPAEDVPAGALVPLLAVVAAVAWRRRN